MGLAELCTKYFETTNLYEIMGISEKANEQEVKKAYHRLSLKLHPDRVTEDEKLEATEKFKILSNIHAVLCDKDKRAIYDETKSLDDDDFYTLQDKDWTVYWRMLFKKISNEDVKAYEEQYTGSEEEKKDIKKAYLAGKGDMNYIVDHVPFARTENEPRIKAIINEMIKDGEVPSYKKFTHESEKKRQRRIAKENREAAEAEKYKKELDLPSGGENNLELMIRERQQARAEQMDAFLDNLAAKYCKKPRAAKRKSSTKNETKTKRSKQ